MISSHLKCIKNNAIAKKKAKIKNKIKANQRTDDDGDGDANDANDYSYWRQALV